MSFSLPPNRIHSHLTRTISVVNHWCRALFASIHKGGLDYRAASLAYTTLLSFIPGLALSFSLLKTFGEQDHLKPFLLDVLEPLGDQAPPLINQILALINRVNVGVLGFMGVAALLYMVIAMLREIESAFNYIWRVRDASGLVRRAGEYLTIALLGPVLAFSSIGITKSIPGGQSMVKLAKAGPFSVLIDYGSDVMSLLSVIAVFTFIYAYIPKTKVSIKAALFGGVLGGVAWNLSGYWFSSFVAESSNYRALYSSVLMVILFMMWLQLSWLILLVGGQAAMFFQYPYYMDGGYAYRNLGFQVKQRLGLSIMALISQAFLRHEPPWTIHRLSAVLLLPPEIIREALDDLQLGGLLEETMRGDGSYVPSQEISNIKVADVLQAMQQGRDDGKCISPTSALPEINKLLTDLENDLMKQNIACLSMHEIALRELGAGSPLVIR